MKILFFTRLYYPHIGGVEKHVYEVAKRLEELGHTVTIVTEELSSTQAQQGAMSTGTRINAAVHHIPVGTDEKGKKFTIWKWLWHQRKLIQDADVVHIHDVFFWYLPFRLLYFGKKVYTTFHGYETVFPPRSNAIKIRKLSWKLSHGTINVGDYIKKWYGTKSNYVTYGGITKTHTTHPERLPDRKIRIVFIGRVAEDTGVRKFIEFLKILEKNKVEYSLTILGRGPLLKEFAVYAKSTNFTDDITPYLNHADVVLASSYLSILESLAEQKLVISLYDNPLKKDYLLMSPFRDFIIAEETPDDAFKKLKFFLFNPNRLKKMLHDGREWAAGETWEKVTDVYLRLWNR